MDRTLEPAGNEKLSFDENVADIALINPCNECFGDRMSALGKVALDKAGFRYGHGERVAWTPCGPGRADHLCCFFRLREQLWDGNPADILWLGDVTANTLEPVTQDAKMLSELYDRQVNPNKYRNQETSLLLKSSDFGTQVSIRTGTNSTDVGTLHARADERVQSALEMLAASEDTRVISILQSHGVLSESGKVQLNLADNELVVLLRELAEAKSRNVSAVFNSAGISVWDTSTRRELGVPRQ